VILPDINLLLHAYNTDSPSHPAARAWWEGLLNSTQPVGLSWATMLGFLRISTHRQVLTNPLPVSTACAHVRAWLVQPYVSILDPGIRHAEILFGLLESLGTAGNLTTDAHLAALAVEHQAEIHSTDADFSRFPGLRWTNPLV
jgi:toxin-antitoxin system PIN domain toxin